MSIENNIRIIGRVEQIVNELQHHYPAQNDSADELSKLKKNLQQLTNYLKKLDQLQPDYNTDEIDEYMQEVDLHVAILKGELTAKDYSRLSRGVTVLKKVLKFHPTKYSPVTFVLAWIYELIYFI